MGEQKRLADSLYECEGVEAHDLAYREWFRTKKTLDDLLQALETSILLFRPNWDRSTMRPKVRHLSPKLVREPSAIVASMFRVLRQVKQPLIVAEIVNEVARDLRLKTARRDQRQRLYSAVHSALKRYEKKGIVSSTGGKPAKWKLVEDIEAAA
ncbi:MAG TPA: hypothetical protein VFI23_05205 [Rhizomicrobium sp.]|nr:hypothetical protein [Rhizomicrobium sp.]